MELQLGDVQETMLIPLAIKANETLRENARICDTRAVEIVKSLGLDTSKYDKFMSHEGVVSRTILFDREIKAWIKKYPDTVCVNLGCGLDGRFTRVDNGKILWYDIDLPDTMAVRRHFYQESDRVKMIDGSVLEKGWTEKVEKGRKTIFLAEGLLMYFSEEQIRRLLKQIRDDFPDFVLLAELMTPFAVKGSKHHDTVGKTKAVFRWGCKSGTELQPLCPGLKLVKEISFNEVMKRFTFFGWLFGTLPGLKNCNDRLAVFVIEEQY